MRFVCLVYKNNSGIPLPYISQYFEANCGKRYM